MDRRAGGESVVWYVGLSVAQTAGLQAPAPAFGAGEQISYWTQPRRAIERWVGPAVALKQIARGLADSGDADSPGEGRMAGFLAR